MVFIFSGYIFSFHSNTFINYIPIFTVKNSNYHIGNYYLFYFNIFHLSSLNPVHISLSNNNTILFYYHLFSNFDNISRIFSDAKIFSLHSIAIFLSIVFPLCAESFLGLLIVFKYWHNFLYVSSSNL